MESMCTQKTALLYNPLELWIHVDNKIVSDYPEQEAVLSIIHKTKFRNKLRRVTFSTNGVSEPVVNGVPGPMGKDLSETYTLYNCTVPASILTNDWFGKSLLTFSFGPLDNPNFTVQVRDHIWFTDPNLNLDNYSTQLVVSITKIGNGIFLGKIFTVSESDLNGPDVLGGGFILS